MQILYNRTMKSRFAYIAIVLAAVTSGTLASCHSKDKDKDKDEAAEAMPVAVAYPVVDSIMVANVYPGNLVADREVGIMARVNGVVTKVHAGSGDKVKKGQLLYSIEDTKYRDAVQQAQATLLTAQSSYEYYKSQYEAMTKALKADAVSEIEVLEAKNNMDQSKAQIESASASLRTAQTMLGYCEIRAPFDGTLALATIDQDDYVNGEDSPVKLNTLYNDNIVHVYISITEAQYIHLTNMVHSNAFSLDSVEVTFSEQLPHRYFSKINYSAPEVNTSTGTVTMRFNMNNTWGELKSGMYANVHLPFETSSRAMIIRNASIGTDQLGKYVYTVNDSNRVVYTPIQVGPIYNDTLRVVTSGITPDSRYVTEALLKVREGMKVKPEAINKPSTVKSDNGK